MNNLYNLIDKSSTILLSLEYNDLKYWIYQIVQITNLTERSIKQMNKDVSTIKKDLLEYAQTFTESQVLYSLTFLSRMFNDDITIKSNENVTVKKQLIEYMQTFKEYQVLYSYTFLSEMFNKPA